MKEKMKSTRETVFKIIEKTEDGDIRGTVFDWFLIILITLNVAAVIAGSFNDIQTKYSKLLTYFEYFSVAIFTIEYLLRVWTAPYKFPPSPKKPSFFARYIFPYVCYIFLSMGFFDLLAILPFYLPFFTADLRVLRIFRLFRLLRVFKLTRYYKTFNLIGRVFKNEAKKLSLTVFIIGTMLLFASSVMYAVENAVQPDVFPNIIATLWWAVITLTTVGYGDVFPVTIVGKLLSGIISILGIILIALPSGIITSGFMNEYEKEKKKKKKEKEKKLFKQAILDELNKNLVNSAEELSKGKYVKKEDLNPKKGEWGGEYIAFDFRRFDGCKLLVGSFSKGSFSKDCLGLWMMLFVNKDITKVEKVRFKGYTDPISKEDLRFREFDNCIVELWTYWKKVDEDEWVELTRTYPNKGFYKDFKEKYIDLGEFNPVFPENMSLFLDDPDVIKPYRKRKQYSKVASLIGKRASYWFENCFIWDEETKGRYKIIDFLEKYVGNNKDIKSTTPP